MRNLAVLFFYLFLCSCSNTLSKDELAKYINDPKNNLIEMKSSAGYHVQVSYFPNDLIKYQYQKNNSNPDESKNFGKYYYFQVELKGEALDGSSVLQQAFSSILTTTTGDNIPANDCISFPTYGITGSSNYILAFENERIISHKPEQMDLILTFPGSNQKVQFSFNYNDILNIPSLQFDNYDNN